MAAWSEMSVGARGGVVAGVAAVIVALLYGAWSVRPVAPAPEAAAVVEPAPAAEGTAAEPAASEAETAATEVAATEAAATEAAPDAAAADVAEPVAEPVVEDVAEDVPEETAGDVAADDAAAPVIEVNAPPVFDLVRVEKDGSALVAGTGASAATISLQINGEEIVAVPADGAGKFVAMFNLAPSEAPRMLGMVMVLADGTEIRSTQTVAIAPTLAPAPLGVAAADGTEAADGSDAVAVAEPVAPAALLVTEEGAKVLQSAEALPDTGLNVTVDSISYSPEGDVQLAGRGMAGAVVRLYLDNRLVGDGLVEGSGDWSVTLPGIAPAVYTLRVDQLDGAGEVTSRFETPFQRETVEALAAAAAVSSADAATQGATDANADAGAADDGVAEGGDAAGADAAGGGTRPVSITVQPGFTLWAIARENLGDGVMYVQVFEANKAQIRDPDLIYPGQVFTLPAE